MSAALAGRSSGCPCPADVMGYLGALDNKCLLLTVLEVQESAVRTASTNPHASSDTLFEVIKFVVIFNINKRNTKAPNATGF